MSLILFQVKNTTRQKEERTEDQVQSVEKRSDPICQEVPKVQKKKEPSPMSCIACELETVHECPDDPVTQDDSVNQDIQDHQAIATSLVSIFCILC